MSYIQQKIINNSILQKKNIKKKYQVSFLSYRFRFRDRRHSTDVEPLLGKYSNISTYSTPDKIKK